ncbi:MAG: ATP-binding protein [Erysipelotrichaceae bacterium]|nr:ATP-binding protein [Erysipelotrichaceae bacterium]
MLLEFKVSNFMSIKDEVRVSCIANTATEHEENVYPYGKDRILPTLAFYGYNAAGKSNIFKALTTAILFVRNSNLMQINTLIKTTPFLLDEGSRKNPTKMDFVFVSKGKKYNYGFEITAKEVILEYLYEYESSRPSMIFERKKEEYNFTTQNSKELEAYKEKNTSNKLFLCTATAWNCQLTKNAFLWFAESIDIYDSGAFNDNQILDYLDANQDNEETKGFLLDVFKRTDFNISDYVFESKAMQDMNVVLPPGITLDQSILDQMKINSKEFKFDALHNVKDEEGNEMDYPISYPFESKGTKMMIAYAPIIKKALELGRIIVVDELDNSLHPLLTNYLIKLFVDKRINKNGAQLIFNSHDTNLLDSELLRRDQIYLVKKDESGQTRIGNLYEYKARRTDNFRKSYFNGKYIGLPKIKDGIDWQFIK